MELISPVIYYRPADSVAFREHGGRFVRLLQHSLCNAPLPNKRMNDSFELNIMYYISVFPKFIKAVYNCCLYTGYQHLALHKALIQLKF